MQEFARARIARYKAPKHVFFVDEFPQTASGKIQKYKLRDMAKEQLGITGAVFADGGADAGKPCEEESTGEAL